MAEKPLRNPYLPFWEYIPDGEPHLFDGRVYVYLADEETGNRFLSMAEDEGFTFADGAAPTKREYAEVMAVNRDKTLNYVGAVGRIAFGAGAETVGGERLIRVDFKKYAVGDGDYLRPVG